MAMRGDLRQVRDGQHLAVGAELAHQPAHGVCHQAADAGIDLVKDQGRGAAELAGGHGNRQCDTRQFAARSDLGNRARRAAGVAGNQKIDGILAAGTGLGGWRDLDLETATFHAKLLHGVADLLTESAGGLLACLRQLLRLERIGSAGQVGGGLQGIQIVFCVQVQQLLLPALPVAGQLLRLQAEAARQRDPGRQALVQLLQPLWVQISAVQVVRQAALHLLQLVLAAGDQRDPVLESGFDMRLFLQCMAGAVQAVLHALAITVQ